MLNEERYFDPESQKKQLAVDLYNLVREAPIVSPHGHVNPAIFVDPDYHFDNPSALLFQSDHYILRMLYSQGVSYDLLTSREEPYKVWETFASNFHLFRGTPSGLWITHELEMVFGVTEKLNKLTAKPIYEKIEAALSSEDFTPRKIFERFNIEVLATTDAATDSLENHKAIQQSGWKGRVVPTFRPDDLINLKSPKWRRQIEQLSQRSGITIDSYPKYIQALEQQRSYFKDMGATAIDIGVASPKALKLSSEECQDIFMSAYLGEASLAESKRFSANMVYEMARMSAEDGLVMQIHSGVHRNHNPEVFQRFGPDMGFDIPEAVEFTNNLHPLLADFGNHPNFRLILFTLDESTYSRELAPLAGAYPTVKLGPPWWFLDSWEGMRRYFDGVMETAGIYNTVGFNDDTRAFLSIPARHDVWRRASANWLAGLLVRGLIDENDAEEMVMEMAVGLARKAYNL